VIPRGLIEIRINLVLVVPGSNPAVKMMLEARASKLIVVLHKMMILRLRNLK
jgi:hypothetical protein